MNYHELCEHPHLRDLPFKIELNEYGTIMMTPVSNRRGAVKAELGTEIRRRTASGHVLLGCVIDTSKGTKVADVAWISPEFFAEYEDTTPYPVAPEVCVEIVSPCSAPEETGQKIELYLAAGAKEVWTCRENDGEVRFFSNDGELAQSRLMSGMPSRIEVS